MTTLRSPTVDQIISNMIDIADPTMTVEVKISHQGDVLWVNIGPICCLRICRIKKLVVERNKGRKIVKQKQK